MLLENKLVKNKMFEFERYNKVDNVNDSRSGQHIPMQGSWKVDLYG